MSIVIPAYLLKKQLKQINDCIPVSRRSRLISDFILSHKLEFPDSPDELKKLSEWEPDGETVIVPMFFSDAAATIIDGYVKKLKSLLDQQNIPAYIGRATVIRFILDAYAEYLKDNPIKSSEKQFFVVHVSSDVKDKLDHYIDKMERSSTIDGYISEEYKGPGPGVTAKHIKARIAGEKVQLPLYLDVETIDRATDIANQFVGQHVTKTHIIRHAINELLNVLEKENPRKKVLQNKLQSNLDELMKHAEFDEIQEMLELYKTKKDET
ncbi:hypothetical protein [Bacillus mesophilum]|uniref:Uncharacterized protein n=1 Tax=Bacillus mesophilum TaxID=1071718 RepID=A0A7V7RI32_9BACI|nr:hypothetical protein [Bacillus mesophilum]KAB2329474.1 hypothetical protein F7732_21350 [Bacillus mesophilum]